MKGAFLINASRSGSTMMSAILQQHPEVLSLSELMTTQGTRALLPGKISGQSFWQQLSTPTPLLRRLANPKTAPNEFLYHTRAGGRFDPFNCPPILAVTLPHLFENPDRVFDALADSVANFPHQTRAAHYQALIAVLGEITKRGVWVERSGGSLLATGSLATEFPEAKFVLILRDGRDVVLSMQKYKPARFLVWFWKWSRRFGINIFRPGSHIGNAGWIAQAEGLLTPALPIERIISREPALKDVAACWSALVTSGLAQFTQLPEERRLVMRYEEITRNPHRELSAMAHFLELQDNPSWLEMGSRIPRRLPPRYLSLPAGEREKLDQWTQPARKLCDALL